MQSTKHKFALVGEAPLRVRYIEFLDEVRHIFLEVNILIHLKGFEVTIQKSVFFAMITYGQVRAHFEAFYFIGLDFSVKVTKYNTKQGTE